MNVQFIIKKPLNTKGVENFMDSTTKNIARTTLSMTAGHFPRLTGDLERGSYSYGVSGGNNSYSLGTTVSYGSRVWDYPQNTNWTNPSTLAQWYYKVFQNHKEGIVNQAINGVNITL